MFSIAFCFTKSGWAAEKPVVMLEKTLSHIQTMQADFSETVSSGGQVNQKLSGTFVLQRPGKFFWKTTQPIHQEIISDGKKLWIYDKDLEQIMVRSLMDNVGATPALLLNGKGGTIARDYRVMADCRQDCIYTLIPKQKTLYRHIQISFKGEMLTHMRFEDTFGQLTDFYFNHVKKNIPINANVFQFNPPKDVDIVNG